MSVEPWANPDLDDFLDEEEAPLGYGKTEWVDSVTGEIVPAPPGVGSGFDRFYPMAATVGHFLERRLAPFRINDDAAAEWAMRKLRTLKTTMAEKRQFAKDRKEAIDRWLTVITNPLESSIAFFEKLLEDYARRVREADPKRKSVVLPSGSVGTTHHDTAVQITRQGRADHLVHLPPRVPRRVVQGRLRAPDHPVQERHRDRRRRTV